MILKGTENSGQDFVPLNGIGLCGTYHVGRIGILQGVQLTVLSEQQLPGYWRTMHAVGQWGRTQIREVHT